MQENTILPEELRMESLHYLLMKTHTMVQRDISAQAQKLGLSPGQPKVLDYLRNYEGSDQKTIAAYCEIEQATVGRILIRMEDAGLIDRRQKPGNRRSWYIYLTEKGRAAAEDLQAIFEQADRRAARALSTQEQAQLKGLLQTICESMQAERED